MPKVFVHGNPETDAIWSTLRPALESRGVDDVVALSPPGFGAAVPDSWRGSHRDYVRWLASELDALDGPIDIVGHDWGAGHVFGLLDDRPGLVRTWATDCLGLIHPDYQWHDAAQAWQTPGVGEEAVAAMIAAPDADRIALLVGLGMSDEAAAGVAAGMNDDMAACILTLYRSARQPALADLGARLAGSELPRGLALIATEDHYTGTVEMCQEQAAALGATTHVLEGLGHWWMFAGAEQAANALVAHWSAA